MEGSTSTIAPLLLRNLLISGFVFAEKSFVYLFQKYRILEFIRSFIVSILLFFLNLLPSLFSALTPPQEARTYALKPRSDDGSSSPIGGGVSAAAVRGGGGGNSGVSRALSQLLLIMNEIPVSSRKYEVVRALIEKLIDENLLEGNRALREVNCAVLSAAFSRSLSQLESAVVEQGRIGGGDGEAPPREREGVANRLLKGVSYLGRVAWLYANSWSERRVSRSGSSAEKLAAELLWLAQKMASSGCAEEAVFRWASALKLSLLAFSADPRLQGSLVKLSAFLIVQAKDIGKEQEEGGNAGTPLEQQYVRQTKVKMLVSWLPLLCHANSGTDAPILSMAERGELEKTLEEIIATLEEDQQELVLSLWLHHFTYCPASDWPNLRTCYTQWYGASRAKLLAAASAAVN